MMNGTEYYGAPFLYHFKLCASFGRHWWIQIGVTVRKRSIRSKSSILWPLWPWNLTYGLTKLQGTFRMLFRCCASFRSHPWIATGITVRKVLIWVKSFDFPSHVSLKFDRKPWKLGRPFKITSSFAHHFVAICELKTGVTVRKLVQILFYACDLDLCPWSFAWTPLL